MSITISKTYDLIWTLKDATNYQFTKDGKCFNTLRNKEVKRVLVGGSIGFCIKGKFQSLTKLRNNLVKIEKSNCPF